MIKLQMSWTQQKLSTSLHIANVTYSTQFLLLKQEKCGGLLI